MLQEFNELNGVHLIVSEPMITIMLREILTRRDSRRIKQSELLI